MVYLASPYTDEDDIIMQDRYEAVCKAVAVLIEMGVFVYSPIALFHPIAKEYNLPREHTFWAKLDKDVISKCEYMLILKLDGWKESKGIAEEILICAHSKIPVYYIYP